MMEWFLTVGGEKFNLFGPSHLVMLFLYVVGAFLLLFLHKKILSNHRLFQTIRWTFFTLLLACEITYQTWAAINGIWVHNLPFHLCGIAGLVGAAALFTLNKKLMVITFYIALIPALLALLTPDLSYDFPNFRYFKFFIHHITISLTAIFVAIIASESKAITFKGMLETYLYLVIYAFLAGLIINPWLNANYLFLSHPPVSATPLDWFGTGIWYRLNLGVVCFIVFFLQFLSYRPLQRKW
ncbi:YwaF family protein [Oceanobacillus alkalisoli]|uniref:YwaF family protein n=1 Tax=Oceanobacillus alkalisoli TaxID=2925113 RepID=UPI001EE3C9A8|nr:TIGR02206 family membrane protein [Oceanobacillus alkalisoli]MCG5103784.1 TIGR02206 family membrane protein [Oceanobacillus alkalisoli]